MSKPTTCNKLLIEWAEELNVNKHLIQKRLTYGWGIERALCEPVNECGRGHKKRYPNP